jgi:hypothetical protein
LKLSGGAARRASPLKGISSSTDTDFQRGSAVQHKGNEDLFETLRKAAQQVRMLTAQTIGTGAVMAGSYIAKKILETLPEQSNDMPAMRTSEAPADKAHAHPKRAA